jgi:hypothetical protein
MLISMNNWRIIKRTLAVLLILVAGCFVVLRTDGHEEQRGEKDAREQWEYLVVAGPSTTNFEPTGNPSMRKESNSGFGREAFVLEQHLDRLGRKGWELIDVAGPPTDPAYYFRRRK